MCINTEDIPQAVLQLYIYLRKEYDLDAIEENWDDTKHFTLINLTSSLCGICIGATFTLLQLVKLYHEANPKNKTVYDTTGGKVFMFGGAKVEESIVYSFRNPDTRVLASIGFISFSLMNIFSTIFILSHVTAELWPEHFGFYYIGLRLTSYYILALISWWGVEGPASLLHSLTYIIVMFSRVPILDKSHSLFGQKLYMILVVLDIPLNLVVYFYANNWQFGYRSQLIDATLCTISGISFFVATSFFMVVCLAEERSTKWEDED